MTVPSAVLRVLLLKFDLNGYTSWWNSPQAALYFWSGFTLFALLIVALLGIWIARTRRS